MIYSIGMTITAFLAVLLSVKKNKTAADSILLLWLSVALLHQVLNYLDLSDVYQSRFSFLVGANLPLPLVHGPFLFIYVSLLTGILPKNKKLMGRHFLPALIFYTYLAIDFFQLPVQQKLFVMSHKGAGYENLVLARFIAIIVSGLVYISWSLYKIKIYQSKIIHSFSNTEKINLQWLKVLSYGMGIIWMAILLGGEKLSSIAISLFVSAIGFFGVRQIHVFSDIQVPPATHNPGVTNAKEPAKYESSGLSADKKEIIKDLLTRQIDENKLFLDPDLSLDALAAAVSFHPNYVSQYINEVVGLSFRSGMDEVFSLR